MKNKLETELLSYRELVDGAKINILGTEYTIEIADKKVFSINKNTQATCEFYDKKICLREDLFIYKEDNFDNFIDFINEIIMHEMVHAFLYESGMSGYETDECVVEWIARFTSKMLNSFHNIKYVNK